MQFYKNGFRGGNPDVKQAAPNRRNRGAHEPLPEKVDVLIAGTGPAGLCLAAQLARFPEIDTMIVERMPSNIIKGKADGINTRTMEMFQAFGFADKVKRETYWVNQTAFWMPDPANPAHIKRVGRVQDVADDSSEMPHILINQARLHELFLEVMQNSPSRLAPDYGWELVSVEVDETTDDHPVTVTLKDASGINWWATRTVRANYVVGCDGAHSAVRKSIGGVSERMLAQTLQWLEADGLVLRTAYQVVPPHVEYCLTPLGIEAAERVRHLADWIETNLPRIMDSRDAVRAAAASTRK